MNTLFSLLLMTTASWAAPGQAEFSDVQLQQQLQDDNWRVRHEAGLELNSRLKPDMNEAIYRLTPMPTRAGTPRFQSELFSNPAASWSVAERLLRGGDSPDIRSALAGAHASIPDSDPSALLYIARHDRSPLVRSAAVAGLARYSEKAGLNAIQIGMEDSHARVRATAVSSAGYHKDGASLEQSLIEALEDSDPQVRSQAARVLGWLEAEAAVLPLRTLLRDSSAEVRLHALRSLRALDLETTRSLPELKQLAQYPDERMQVILNSLQTP